jgi:MFS family permease
MPEGASLRGIYSWLTEASSTQKQTLLAASLGWMLDSMDIMLYSLVLGQVQRELHLSAAMAGGMMSVTLLSAAVGGIVFGWFADRSGRTRALMASVLIYSVFTAACGLAHTGLQLMICRILLGLGMGGEWASGAALVAETWPAKHRAKALGLVQSSWAIGYALGALIVALVMPHFGWRPVFFAGIIPALLTLWFRKGLKEPEVWLQEKINLPNKPLAKADRLFSRPYLRSLLVCTTMNAAALYAYWGLFTWMPRFLSLPSALGGHGLNVVKTSGWTIAIQAGAFLGYVLFGYIADRFSRKYTYIGYLAIASLLVPLFVYVRSPGVLLFIGPLLGFFGTGYFSGFSVISSELFPVSIRASAMGFAYNTGRIASAAAPYIIGYLSEHAGLSTALRTTAIGFILAALLATTLRMPTSRQLSENFLDP